MNEFKSEMHNRFDKVEVKLEGIGGQFELTNESKEWMILILSLIK